MKTFAVVLAAVLLFTAPSFAQLQVTSPRDVAATGNLTTNPTDSVVVSLSGAQWATVQFMATSAGTATVSSQVTLDGLNWMQSMMATRLTALTQNPSVVTISGATLVANEVWEVPLPANALGFRLQCLNSGTTTTVIVRAGRPYVPGMVVSAVQSDNTSGVNSVNDTFLIDFSGWTWASVLFVTPAGGSGSVFQIDDVGSLITEFTVPASAQAWYTFSNVYSGGSTAVTALPATGATGNYPLLKRMRFQAAAVAALTSRIRVEVRR